MSGQPAARVGDLHVCPMVTPAVPPVPHVGGPVLPPGGVTVLIGGLPAARMGDMAVCVGPPDSIVKGAFPVPISRNPAARLGDQTAHGGTVMMGCPKFDDAENYIERFTEIINTCQLKSLTVLIMEVPCCSAMNVIVKKALERAEKTVPVEQITISRRGEEIARQSW